jgi:hypothetical protein
MWRGSPDNAEIPDVREAYHSRRAGRPTAEQDRARRSDPRVPSRVHGAQSLKRGHGVGRTIHEEPTIPNHFERRLTAPFTEGLVVTLEPVITSGTDRTTIAVDGWPLINNTLRNNGGGESP